MPGSWGCCLAVFQALRFLGQGAFVKISLNQRETGEKETVPKISKGALGVGSNRISAINSQVVYARFGSGSVFVLSLPLNSTEMLDEVFPK